MARDATTGKEITEAELQAFLAGYDPRVQTLVRQVRALVWDVIPAPLEQIDVAAKLIGYGFQQTYRHTICVIMPLKSGVNLGFPRGTELPDPSGLLVGTGKGARHVKITAGAQVEEEALRTLLAAAVAATPQ
ncbi:MAG: DUF1801 domain-containing protein [Chloroflexi bacterium]|nr:DUF1801 domain-containing protein [Chloroflexota bacterium]